MGTGRDWSSNHLLPLFPVWVPHGGLPWLRRDSRTLRPDGRRLQPTCGTFLMAPGLWALSEPRPPQGSLSCWKRLSRTAALGVACHRVCPGRAAGVAHRLAGLTQSLAGRVFPSKPGRRPRFWVSVCWLALSCRHLGLSCLGRLATCTLSDRGLATRCPSPGAFRDGPASLGEGTWQLGLLRWLSLMPAALGPGTHRGLVGL